jgi:hypothetical protein
MSGFKDATGREIPPEHFENDAGDPGRNLSPQAEAQNDALLKKLMGEGNAPPAPAKPTPSDKA